jgi:hypothetical protein
MEKPKGTNPARQKSTTLALEKLVLKQEDEEESKVDIRPQS